MVLLFIGGAGLAWIVAGFIWRQVKRQPKVEGQTVFITGGSEGIGKALALDFVRRGAHVVIMARTEAKLKAALAEMEALKCSEGQKVGYQCVDVTDYESVKTGMGQAVEKFGQPYFLATCAGACYPGYFLDQEPEVFERTMGLNYMGSVHAIKAVAPMMKDQGAGKIMIVASAAAVVSFIGYASYSPTKFALRGLADTLRNELSGFGIQVSICYPPDTDTPGFQNEEKSKPPETKACFPGDAYAPEVVARQSISSWLKGDYHIQSADILQNLVVSSMSGVTPRPFPILETCLLPIVTLVEQLFPFWFDIQARRYATREKSSGSDTTTQDSKKDS